MNTADLITAYLNNEMSPEQERQFLLSVAASDSLRLSLKSHVMLDRIVFEQARDTRVPDGVRGTIFAEMSASLAAGGGGSSASPYADGLRAATSSPGGAVSALSRLGIVKGFSIAVLALSGFGAGYLARLGVETSPRLQQATVAPVLEHNGSQLQSLLFSTALVANIPATTDVATLDSDGSTEVVAGMTHAVEHHGRANRLSNVEGSASSRRVAEPAVNSTITKSSDISSVKPSNNPLDPNFQNPDTPVSPSAETHISSPQNIDSGKAPSVVSVEGGPAVRSKSTAPSSEEPPK